MKRYVKPLILISIALIVTNCTNDEKMPVQGRVQFAIEVSKKPLDGGRVASNVFPDSAYVSLSIETSSGVSVYSLKSIELIKLGDGYITSPVALTEGNYRLTDFMIRSKNNEVLYATPKEGSSLALLVDDPLPVNFSVTKNGVINLNVQVVSSTQQIPEDFGYVSFGVTLVGGDFSVSLFTTENNSLNLTSGTLSIYLGNTVVHTQDLLPKGNLVNFKSDPNTRYTLVVRKKGYTIRTREYKLADLLGELQGKPLMFLIEPALTLEVIPKSDLDTTIINPFFLSIEGSAVSSFQIDWGDGIKEKPIGYRFGTNNEMADFALSHNFLHVAGKLLFINITGNVEDIFDFRYNYNLPVTIQAIDLTSLGKLTTFISTLTWIDGPDFIDFSKNSKLTTIDLQDSQVKEIDISNIPGLLYLVIQYTGIQAENLNEIVGDLHKNATENNVHQGIFSFTMWPVQPELTQESQLKLLDLRNNYGWALTPDPQ